MSEEEYFYVDVFPAGYGDCFMVRCADKGKKTNILIDGGLRDTYHKHLKYYLKEMKKNSECIDLLVVTHIDNDHIEGIIEFLRENNSCKNPITIREIWHNGLIHLIPKEKRKKKEKATPEDIKLIQGIIDVGVRKKRGKNVADIGASEGVTLSSLILSGNYEKVWNRSFAYNSASIDNSKEPYISLHGVQIKLISPTELKLKKLKKIFLDNLRISSIFDKLGYDEAFEFNIINLLEEQMSLQNISSESLDFNIPELLKEPNTSDSSVANGSSIAFSLKFLGYKALFLGDSHSSTIKNIPRDSKNFNFVKVSHHGSKSNSSKKINEYIEGEVYLFSTDGSHENFKHPNLVTIARIVKDKKKRDLVFNYPIDLCTSLKNDLEYNYRKIINKKGYILRYDIINNKYYFIKASKKGITIHEYS